jgi:hypothetical protein
MKGGLKQSLQRSNGRYGSSIFFIIVGGSSWSLPLFFFADAAWRGTRRKRSFYLRDKSTTSPNRFAPQPFINHLDKYNTKQNTFGFV